MYGIDALQSLRKRKACVRIAAVALEELRALTVVISAQRDLLGKLGVQALADLLTAEGEIQLRFERFRGPAGEVFNDHAVEAAPGCAQTAQQRFIRACGLEGGVKEAPSGKNVLNMQPFRADDVRAEVLGTVIGLRLFVHIVQILLHIRACRAVIAVQELVHQSLIFAAGDRAFHLLGDEPELHIPEICVDAGFLLCEPAVHTGAPAEREVVSVVIHAGEDAVVIIVDDILPEIEAVFIALVCGGAAERGPFLQLLQRVGVVRVIQIMEKIRCVGGKANLDVIRRNDLFRRVDIVPVGGHFDQHLGVLRLDRCGHVVDEQQKLARKAVFAAHGGAALALAEAVGVVRHDREITGPCAALCVRFGVAVFDGLEQLLLEHFLHVRQAELAVRDAFAVFQREPLRMGLKIVFMSRIHVLLERTDHVRSAVIGREIAVEGMGVRGIAVILLAAVGRGGVYGEAVDAVADKVQGALVFYADKNVAVFKGRYAAVVIIRGDLGAAAGGDVLVPRCPPAHAEAVLQQVVHRVQDAARRRAGQNKVSVHGPDGPALAEFVAVRRIGDGVAGGELRGADVDGLSGDALSLRDDGQRAARHFFQIDVQLRRRALLDGSCFGGKDDLHFAEIQLAACGGCAACAECERGGDGQNSAQGCKPFESLFHVIFLSFASCFLVSAR